MIRSTSLPLAMLAAGLAGVAPLAPLAAQAAKPGPTAADAQFMSGMILHHAQAILMASWAATHDASPTLRSLCEKIRVSQTDEIAMMQRWLADHHLPLPDTSLAHARAMPGMSAPMLMPGMLTAAELAQLDSTRGPVFDRQFLEGMIRHHQGAITMVQDLLNTPGAAQDPLIYQYATDISSDQTVEIGLMTRMLAALH
ncbi:MAG TPA: DUF305 domain-containing protein [Gemmatimonadales bacterium]|nr:DUF305 domain-containing protein [Gemmatimonadales bacterium]